MFSRPEPGAHTTGALIDDMMLVLPDAGAQLPSSVAPSHESRAQEDVQEPPACQ